MRYLCTNGESCYACGNPAEKWEWATPTFRYAACDLCWMLHDAMSYDYKNAMRQILINAYLQLSEEAKSLAGEEWRENKERRQRMNRRSMQRYGMPITQLIHERPADH